MHSQSSTLDPELARLARRVPLCGRPKAKPLVEGAFIITRLSKREEKMRSLSMQERHARRYEAGADPVAQRDHERTARRVGVDNERPQRGKATTMHLRNYALR